jgi:phospholipid/cholesterol/gamma-HCH transport system permease protein
VNKTRNIKIQRTDDGSLELKLEGSFTIASGIPDCVDVIAALKEKPTLVTLVDDGIDAWDSALLIFLSSVNDACQNSGSELNIENLPKGVQRLIKLAAAVPEREGASRQSVKKPVLERLGSSTISIWDGTLDAISFVGEITISMGNFFTGKARYRKAELWLIIQQCGPEALGIVTTISVLVGAILAFVGSIQLKMFGAEVYVANLVGLGMVIEMGALMTGIILAGRTGASFAAQIGTMQVNEEIDALKTMGIPPIDYLVLPRVLALAIMTPLLVIYADILGIIGGSVVGIFLLDIPPRLFFDQTFSMMTLWQCMQGLIKGSSFGLLIAIAGCMRGMQCGRSASAVGEAATSAVVTSIVLIVVVDALLTFLFMVIG